MCRSMSCVRSSQRNTVVLGAWYAASPPRLHGPRRLGEHLLAHAAGPANEEGSAMSANATSMTRSAGSLVIALAHLRTFPSARRGAGRAPARQECGRCASGRCATGEAGPMLLRMGKLDVYRGSSIRFSKGSLHDPRSGQLLAVGEHGREAVPVPLEPREGRRRLEGEPRGIAGAQRGLDLPPRDGRRHRGPLPRPERPGAHRRLVRVVLASAASSSVPVLPITVAPRPLGRWQARRSSAARVRCGRRPPAAPRRAGPC